MSLTLVDLTLIFFLVFGVLYLTYMKDLVVMSFINWFEKMTRLPTDDEIKAAQLAEDVRRREAVKRTAVYVPAREVPARSIYLGIHTPAVLGEKPFLPDSRVYISGNKVSLDLSILGGHIAIFGATGYGKTELEKRLLYELFSKTDLNVHLFDGKGNEDLTRAFSSMAYMFGRGNARVFRMGGRRVGYPFNGFRGSPDAIRNKLVALADIAKLEGNATYYGKLHRMIINAIVDAPIGPPRGFDELMQRMTKSWIIGTYGQQSSYKNDRTMQNKVTLMTNKVSNDPSPVDGLALQFYSVIDELGAYVKRDGFTIEDTRAINYSVKLSSVPYVGGYLTEFVFADYLDAMENRIDRPTVLMIDETALMPNGNLERILTLGRQAGLKIIFATQSFASLGEKLDQERILSNCNTQIFFKLLFPDYASDLSGTTMQQETSYQSENGVHTGITSTRFQHQFAIAPNEVRGLPKGQCFVYRDGGNARVAIDMIPELPVPPPEEIYIPLVTSTPPVVQQKHPIP